LAVVQREEIKRQMNTDKIDKLNKKIRPFTRVHLRLIYFLSLVLETLPELL
jgi:hypothetical protein